MKYENKDDVMRIHYKPPNWILLENSKKKIFKKCVFFDNK